MLIYYSNVSLNKETTPSKSPLTVEMIFAHRKCAHFNEDQIVQIRSAYTLADGLHLSQRRANDKPYIIHIDRSISLYLEQTLSEDEQCDPDLLIALILHDCIEDCDDGLCRIIESGIDIKTIINILWMSEPTTRTISQVHAIRESYPFVYSEIIRHGFLDIYSNIDKNPETFIGNLKSDDRLSSVMCINLKSLWYDFFTEKYHSLSK